MAQMLVGRTSCKKPIKMLPFEDMFGPSLDVFIQKVMRKKHDLTPKEGAGETGVTRLKSKKSFFRFFFTTCFWCCLFELCTAPIVSIKVADSGDVEDLAYLHLGTCMTCFSSDIDIKCLTGYNSWKASVGY